MPAPKSVSGCIGVDLVEIKTARAFLRRHGARMHKLLTAAEFQALRKSRKPSEKLAFFLAAKEAIFKAGNKAWMGPAGFRKIRSDDPRYALRVRKHPKFIVVSCQKRTFDALGSAR